MKKRNVILLLCTAVVVSICSTICVFQADANKVTMGNYIITDLKYLQDFLLNRKTNDLSENNYDLNDNGIWNFFDLCLMRQQLFSASNPIPQVIQEIPQNYYTDASEQGTLEGLEYNTYESMTYEKHNQVLQKRAIVYLPYGYSEDKEYNIFYLMHGGWRNETSTFGTPDNPSNFKNVMDHAIQNGEIEPLIIVCPTYNNTSSQDSFNFSLALTLLTPEARLLTI